MNGPKQRNSLTAQTQFSGTNRNRTCKEKGLVNCNPWPSITDAEGRSLLGCAGDLAARLLLNQKAMHLYNRDGPSHYDGVVLLAHAEHYLADRLAYELYPHPKGMILLGVDEESD